MHSTTSLRLARPALSDLVRSAKTKPRSRNEAVMSPSGSAVDMDTELELEAGRKAIEKVETARMRPSDVALPIRIYKAFAGSVALHAHEWPDAGERTCAIYTSNIVRSLGLRYKSLHGGVDPELDKLLHAFNVAETNHGVSHIPERVNSLPPVIPPFETMLPYVQSEVMASITKFMTPKQKTVRGGHDDDKNGSDDVTSKNDPQLTLFGSGLAENGVGSEAAHDGLRPLDLDTFPDEIENGRLFSEVPPLSVPMPFLSEGKKVKYADRIRNHCKEVHALTLGCPIPAGGSVVRCALQIAVVYTAWVHTLRGDINGDFSETELQCLLLVLLPYLFEHKLGLDMRGKAPSWLLLRSLFSPELLTVVRQCAIAPDKCTPGELLRGLATVVVTTTLPLEAITHPKNYVHTLWYHVVDQQLIRKMGTQSGVAYVQDLLLRSTEGIVFDALCTHLKLPTSEREVYAGLRQHAYKQHLGALLASHLERHPGLLWETIETTSARTMTILQQCFEDRHLFSVQLHADDPTTNVAVITSRFALPARVRYPHMYHSRPWTPSGNPYEMIMCSPVPGPAATQLRATQPTMMDALNYFGSVAFRFNKFILHAIEEVARNGFPCGKVPAAFAPFAGKTTLPDERRKVKEHISRWGWFKELLTEIHMVDIDRPFYLPQRVDFRGRMYPVSGILSQTYSDHYRGLFMYADPVPLGPSGLRWLKIHLANLLGKDKVSFDARVNYIDEVVEDVVDIARDPFGPKAYIWQTTEDAFQCLAACKEYADAMSYSQGPENFPSALPVQVDGTANGLQHASAMARDRLGGSAVNLTPCPVPADPYTCVLKDAIALIEVDAEQEVEIARKILGTGVGMDTNHLKRKTVKQSVMTQVYGVTRFGMQEQIRKQLDAQNEAHRLWNPQDIRNLATYVTDKVDMSIGRVFKNAQESRRWLSNLASIIFEAQPEGQRQPLVWTTPLGLMVVQPYTEKMHIPIWTPTGSGTLHLPRLPESASRKQITAITPNLVHSLDAVHLYLTALEMQRLGLSMTSVHDSYWTHAAHMDTLARVLREQFVFLYENWDPLNDVREEWSRMYHTDLKYSGVSLPPPPPKGDLDLREVLDSPYFFS